MARARLTIPEMTCGHCKAHVTTLLEGLEGVQNLEIRLESKEVEVGFDEAVLTLDRIREVLAEEDYPAETAVAI